MRAAEIPVRVATHRCTRCGDQVEVTEIGRILIDPATYVCGQHLQPISAPVVALQQPSQFVAPPLKETA